MRWRSREGPVGSHQLDASALKWDTSVGSTEDFEASGVDEIVEESRGAGFAEIETVGRT